MDHTAGWEISPKPWTQNIWGPHHTPVRQVESGRFFTQYVLESSVSHSGNGTVSIPSPRASTPICHCLVSGFRVRSIGGVSFLSLSLLLSIGAKSWSPERPSYHLTFLEKVLFISISLSFSVSHLLLLAAPYTESYRRASTGWVWESTPPSRSTFPRHDSHLAPQGDCLLKQSC